MDIVYSSLDGTFKGWEHRDHRTRKTHKRPSNTINKRKEILEKIKQSEEDYYIKKFIK